MAESVAPLRNPRQMKLIAHGRAALGWPRAKLYGSLSGRLAGGFILSLAMLVCIGILAHEISRQQAKTVDWVEHTHEVKSKTLKLKLPKLRTASGHSF
jgi:hypothetical protein